MSICLYVGQREVVYILYACKTFQNVVLTAIFLNNFCLRREVLINNIINRFRVIYTSLLLISYECGIINDSGRKID